MSLVKVFVPCYRYAHFLPAAVRSVLAQPGVEVRVLIVDDCSPDDTPAVARALMAEDARVAYHRNPVNIGHIASYNIGLEWASDGDYTVLLSADDMLTPGALRRAVELLDANPGVGFAHGGAVVFHDHGALPPARTPEGPGRWRLIDGERWLAEACRAGHVYIRSPEVVVRTSLQRRLGGYRPELPHTGDIEMWMRFAAHAKVGEIVDADQAYYRIHNQNMHLRQFSAHLVELGQRKAAYEALFTAYGQRIRAYDQLRGLVRRRLARQALGAAGEIYDRGEASGGVAADLLTFALTTDPGASRTPEYLGLQARMLLGPRVAPWLSRARSALAGASRAAR